MLQEGYFSISFTIQAQCSECEYIRRAILVYIFLYCRLALSLSICMVPNIHNHSYDAVALQWLKLSSDDVKEQIYKLAKKGLTPSQIGVYNCLP